MKKIEIVSIEEVAAKPPRWLWDGYLARNGINVIVGAKGVGKTSLSCWIAAQASRGTAAFGGTPHRVFIDSLEDDAGIVIRPRIEAAGGDMAMIETRRPGQPAWRFPHDTDALANYVATCEQQDTPVGLLIFDSLAAFIPRFTTPQETDETLEALTRLTERFGCALLFVHHFNKTGRTVESAIGGASAVTRVARSVYLFAPEPRSHSTFVSKLLDPQSAGDDDGDSLILACQKLNIAQKPTSVRFKTEAVEIPSVESVQRLVFAGEADWTAEALFEQVRRAPENPEQQTEVETAIEWLLNYLVDGPRPTRQMFADANAEGFSKRTMERARAKLKLESIHPNRIGERLSEEELGAFGEDVAKGWWVGLAALPDAPPDEWASG